MHRPLYCICKRFILLYDLNITEWDFLSRTLTIYTYYTNIPWRVLYNTLLSRDEICAKIVFEIFSREDNFREYTVHAKISSREILFPRKYLPAKNSSRENIFPRIVSVPQICRLVGQGYAVYYCIT